MCKMKVKPSRYTVPTQTARTAVQATSPTVECYVLSNTQVVILDLPIFIFSISVLYRQKVYITYATRIKLVETAMSNFKRVSFCEMK